MPPILGNESFQTAQDLLTPTIPRTASGSLSKATGGDLSDYFKFAVTGSSSVSASITGLTGNARLRLFSAPNEGSELQATSANNPQRLAESFVGNLATAGTYFIKVELDADPSVTSADYTLNLSANTNVDYSTLFWRAPDGANGLWLIDGKTLGDSGVLTPALNSQWRTEIADFNGDGEDDILWQNTVDGAVGIWLMRGRTIIEAVATTFNGQPLSLNGGWQSQVGDFDDDGKDDLLWRNESTGTNVVWLMNGTAIKDADLPPGFTGTWRAQVADFDGNGKDDILWRNGNIGAMGIWMMDGKNLETPTSFSYFTDIPEGWVPTAIDLTGEGGADIFWRNTTSGENALWIMTGKDRQSFDFLADVPITWKGEVGDFNNDEKGDIFWRQSTGENAIWQLDGTKAMGQKLASIAVLESLPTTWTLEAVTDFNSDRKDDVILRNSDGTVKIWLLDGSVVAAAPAGPSIITDPIRDRADLAPVPLTFALDSILERNLINTPKSIAGSTEQTAFDIGILNTGTNINPVTPGVYRDSVTALAPDFFKFNLATTSNFKMTPTGSVTLELFKQGVNGAASTPVPYTAGMELSGGVYFIKVATVANTETPYTLTLEGIPRIVNLVGDTFTAPALVNLTQPTDAVPEPANTINISYNVKNEGTVSVSGVKVNFVISRDSTITATDTLIGTDIISTIAAGGSGGKANFAVTLPKVTDAFWTVDRNYYVGIIIDSDNAFTETSELDNFGVAATKDFAIVDVRDTITADPAAFSISVPDTATAGSAVTSSYQVRNAGNKSIDTGVQVTFFLSKGPLFGGDDDFTYSPRTSAPLPRQTTLASVDRILTLPNSDDAFWAGLTGPQQFYIGYKLNLNNAVLESDGDNNEISELITITI
ncbi:MAG: hypothetical protein HC780_07435 [Leptolyngbyaceae cyanobacterium CSU_1_3]|nr:hypothetical protein [Leptolyngbyaceae cyanobacterium CSU_1_3]